MRKPLRAPTRTAALAALLAGLVAVLLRGGAGLPVPTAVAAGLGEGYVIYENAEPVPDISFKHKTGGLVREVSLRDFAGKVVVLNFWATWCPPCVAEMPSLDRLQAALGPEGVEVVALSEDRGGFAQVDPFYEARGLERLERYVDEGGALGRHFAIRAMPTTILIGPDGIPVGAVEGAAEWDSPEAQKLLRALLKQ
ncbi:MAG: TlpA disulfide reductase family protein [Tistlia sp.]|uniref:TlpA family protein disulfide reductase n=1 Tax=Tistlia sp. TaxID=3057121 RepID=UPI0034A586CE